MFVPRPGLLLLESDGIPIPLSLTESVQSRP